ncbi:cyanophycinase [Flavobacterium sp.]|uniref:cyanophycinase n=1 Tax=Flavobacterium sp. TaxID=239 RepID=UPI00286A4450|nr:cyanophycinase [Flavobacterium sp.]
MKFKGKFIIIGGPEDGVERKSEVQDFIKTEILERLISESAKNNHSRIEIVTTASAIPEEIGKEYQRAFDSLGLENVGILNMVSRKKSETPEVIKRIQESDVVLFTGGDQIRLTSVLGGSLFFDTIRERLSNDASFIYVGISASGAAASESMICAGESNNAINKGDVQTGTGFGLVENVIFDTHFINRGRIGRLLQIVVTNPKILGIGLEENSGVLIQDNKMEAIGCGMIIIIDGQEIKNSNLLDVKSGVPLSIENLKLHVMSQTDIFDLNERKLTIVTPEECRL